MHSEKYVVFVKKEHHVHSNKNYCNCSCYQQTWLCNYLDHNVGPKDIRTLQGVQICLERVMTRSPRFFYTMPYQVCALASCPIPYLLLLLTRQQHAINLNVCIFISYSCMKTHPVRSSPVNGFFNLAFSNLAFFDHPFIRHSHPSYATHPPITCPSTSSFSEMLMYENMLQKEFFPRSNQDCVMF